MFPNKYQDMEKPGIKVIINLVETNHLQDVQCNSRSKMVQVYIKSLITKTK